MSDFPTGRNGEIHNVIKDLSASAIQPPLEMTDTITSGTQTRKYKNNTVNSEKDKSALVAQKPEPRHRRPFANKIIQL